MKNFYKLESIFKEALGNDFRGIEIKYGHIILVTTVIHDYIVQNWIGPEFKLMEMLSETDDDDYQEREWRVIRVGLSEKNIEKANQRLKTKGRFFVNFWSGPQNELVGEFSKVFKSIEEANLYVSEYLTPLNGDGKAKVC